LYISLLFLAHCKSIEFFVLIEKSKCLQYSRKNIIFASTISATPLYNAYQGGTYFYIHMITYTKQPISIADQIAMLKNRGLLFEK